MGDARRISCLTAVSSIMSSLTTAPRSWPRPPTLLSPNPYFSPYLLYSLLIPSLVNHSRDVALWCRQLRGSLLSSFPHLKALSLSPIHPAILCSYISIITWRRGEGRQKFLGDALLLSSCAYPLACLWGSIKSFACRKWFSRRENLAVQLGSHRENKKWIGNRDGENGNINSLPDN